MEKGTGGVGDRCRGYIRVTEAMKVKVAGQHLAIWVEKSDCSEIIADQRPKSIGLGMNLFLGKQKGGVLGVEYILEEMNDGLSH